jgi:hypothetical protein
MGIIEAIELLKEGKRIKRKSDSTTFEIWLKCIGQDWRDKSDIYALYRSNQVNGEIDKYKLTGNDIMGNDWIECEI